VCAQPQPLWECIHGDRGCVNEGLAGLSYLLGGAVNALLGPAEPWSVLNFEVQCNDEEAVMVLVKVSQVSPLCWARCLVLCWAGPLMLY